MSEIVREIGSAIAKLRTLVAQPRRDPERILQVYTSLTSTLDLLWDNEEFQSVISSADSWMEVVNLLGSGRILATAAQAGHVLSSTQSYLPSGSWISNGSSFAGWLARGIIRTLESNLVVNADGVNRLYISRLADLCGKALSMGQADTFVEGLIFSPMFLGEVAEPCIRILLQCLSKVQQYRLLDSSLSILSSKYLAFQTPQGLTSESLPERAKIIGGAAALLRWMMTSAPELEPHLFDWLSHVPWVSNDLLRASICTLEGNRKAELLQKTVTLFNDKLFIRHASLVQQEVAAQILLVSSGYVFRENPMELFVVARSGDHISGISEHLASSSARVRFLGMVCATAMSALVDKDTAKLRFDLEELEQPDLKWYQNLVELSDRPTSVKDLQRVSPVPAEVIRYQPQTPIVRNKQARQEPEIHKIVEVMSEENIAEHDLHPYLKPASDQEDSEDDATMVARNKPRKPVYIRDLIRDIGDPQDYDRNSLALMTAPNLIRRKADFGTELRDRAIELGSLLVGLSDKFEMDGFENYRLQSMLALLVAQPSVIGPLYVSYVFNGDFSVEQRVTTLNALRLGAQEIVGARASSLIEKESSQPLPERLHRMYTEQLDVRMATKEVQSEAPTGPVPRHFKVKVNKDHRAVVTERIYQPLLATWQFASRSGTKPISSILLPTLIKTVALVFTACGPNNMKLPQLTTETWELLLAVRARASADRVVLEAVLYALLTVLRVNEDKRQLTLNHGKQLAETQHWVQMIHERTIGGSEEDEISKTLAASILVTINDIVNTYQRLLLGSVMI